MILYIIHSFISSNQLFLVLVFYFVLLLCYTVNHSKVLILINFSRYHVASGVVPGVQTKAREKTTKQRGVRAFSNNGHALLPLNQSQNRKKRRRNCQKNTQLLRRRKRMKYMSCRQWQMIKRNLPQSRFLNQLLMRKNRWQGRNLLELQRYFISLFLKMKLTYTPYPPRPPPPPPPWRTSEIN